MNTGPAMHAEKMHPRRLSRRERAGLAALAALTVPAVLGALKAAFFAALTFEGEPSSRDSSIANHALRAVLWAIVTPFAAWLLLRHARLAWFGVVAWFGLLIWSAWWWWPTPPTDIFDTEVPVWHSSTGIILWLLAAAGLTIGVYVSLQSRQMRLTRMAIGLVIATVSLGVWSAVRLDQHARAEVPAPLSQGTVELTTLRADPFWAALPRSPRTTAHGENPATLTVSGERTPTVVWRYLGDRYDAGLFLTLVAAAESNGWQLRGTSCYEHDSWDAVFSKSFTVGNARMRIAVATYLRGVGVDAEIAAIGYPGKPGKCWETTK
jgi:hypothetical protein